MYFNHLSAFLGDVQSEICIKKSSFIKIGQIYIKLRISAMIRDTAGCSAISWLTSDPLHEEAGRMSNFLYICPTLMILAH
jgi:hypothetical protein